MTHLKPKRVAIYARVSTTDKGQDPMTQLLPLREYCERRGFIVGREFVEHASGVKNDRPAHKAMMTAVARREFDVVLVWRYDRFARSLHALVNAFQQFRALGVDFISIQENIDTSSPAGELIFHIMASVAQFERALISERTSAGMSRARAQGKRIGRGAIGDDVQQQIRTLHTEGLSPMKISKRLGIGYGTVVNYLKKVD